MKGIITLVSLANTTDFHKLL